MEWAAIIAILAGLVTITRATQRVSAQTQGRFIRTSAPRGNSDDSSAPNLGQQGQTVTFEEIYKQFGKRYGINPRLLRAIAMTESGEAPNAVNPADPSVGLMQILCVPDGRGGCSNRFNIDGWPPESKDQLFDPAYNVWLGAQILDWNLRTYGFPKGIAVYNNWSARNENGPPFSNQEYVDKVLNFYSEFGGGHHRNSNATL